MGANHSHPSESRRRDLPTKDRIHKGSATLQSSTVKNYESNAQGKPSPPCGVPVITDITHSSLLLSWQPPILTNGGSIIAYMIEMYSASDRQWITLTRSCQGTSYKVRNLQSDAEFQFRVRAENIFGRSKSGPVSERIQTSSFDVHDFSPSKSQTVTVKRRHSLNTYVPVEGRVAAILNHSSPVIETTQVKYSNDSHNTLQRDSFRSSIQSMKKRSGSSLIPGTKSNSLVRLRTSHSKLPTEAQTRMNNHSSQNSLEDSVEKIDPVSDSDTKSDLCNDCNTGSQSSSSDNSLQDHHCNNNKYVEEHHRDVSDKIILAAPVCDDLKLALYSKKVECYSDEKLKFVSDEGIDTSGPMAHDFRTLRSMLQSSDVIIKPTQSLPEISDMCRRKSGRGSLRQKLMTIVDEEDDDVQVTTL